METIEELKAQLYSEQRSNGVLRKIVAEEKKKLRNALLYKTAWLSLARRLEITLSTVCIRRNEIEQWMDKAMLDASNEGVTDVSERLRAWSP